VTSFVECLGEVVGLTTMDGPKMVAGLDTILVDAILDGEGNQGGEPLFMATKLGARPSQLRVLVRVRRTYGAPFDLGAYQFNVPTRQSRQKKRNELWSTSFITRLPRPPRRTKKCRIVFKRKEAEETFINTTT